MPSKKDKGGFKSIIADLFELPREVMMDLPRMTLVGNVQIYLENHRGVIAYDERQVRIGVNSGEIIIRGRELEIKNLLAEELLIKGIIEGLEYEG
jgi:sporulation protein YqfC